MLLKWKQRDGTSGLINHSKSCAKNKTLTARDRTLKDVGAVVVSQTKQKILPASLKSEVADAAVMMCATDIRYVVVGASALRVGVFINIILVYRNWRKVWQSWGSWPHASSNYSGRSYAGGTSDTALWHLRGQSPVPSRPAAAWLTVCNRTKLTRII